MRNADWSEPDEPLDPLERSYLDANCGHCHNPFGPAAATGFWLNARSDSLRPLGLCKPPIAVGQGMGGRRCEIVPGQPVALHLGVSDGR